MTGPFKKVRSAALALRYDPVHSQFAAPREVPFSVKDTEMQRSLLSDGIKFAVTFSLFVLDHDHVAATVGFELEVVACGFTLPTFALCRHVSTLIHHLNSTTLIKHS